MMDALETTEAGAAAAGAWGDWVGVAASVGCAIHCAAMPFVIAYLPSLGLSFLADEAFHQWMAVGCFAIALVAFVPGLRTHGRLTPAVVGGAGLMMISVAAFGFAGECCPSCEMDAAPAAASTAASCADAGCTLCPSNGAASPATGAAALPADLAVAPPTTASWLGRLLPWLTPLGGVVLVSAHLLNRRYGCLCGCCGDAEPEGGAE